MEFLDGKEVSEVNYRGSGSISDLIASIDINQCFLLFQDNNLVPLAIPRCNAVLAMYNRLVMMQPSERFCVVLGQVAHAP